MSLSNVLVTSSISALTSILVTSLLITNSDKDVNSIQQLTNIPASLPRYISNLEVLDFDNEAFQIMDRFAIIEEVTSANELKGQQLERRVGELEKRYRILDSKGLTHERKDEFAFEEGDMRKLAAEHPLQVYRRHVQGEEIFINDYGDGSDFTSESIKLAFEQSANDLSLQKIECRSTICKVTYTENVVNTEYQRYGIDSAKDTLLMNISNEFNGEDLDIRHGRDDTGNEVMYIQIL